jgi:hypothetical protein
VQALLVLDNPDGIVDSVFGLLGNAAAANGAGQIAVMSHCVLTAFSFI